MVTGECVLVPYFLPPLDQRPHLESQELNQSPQATKAMDGVSSEADAPRARRRSHITGGAPGQGATFKDPRTPGGTSERMWSVGPTLDNRGPTTKHVSFCSTMLCPHPQSRNGKHTCLAELLPGGPSEAMPVRV